MLKLAAIGLGSRASHVIHAMKQIAPDLHIVAIADPNDEAVMHRLAQFDPRLDSDDMEFYAEADALIEHADAFDGVIIGTHCNLHTPMACKVAPTGLPLFLEKPVAVTPDQLSQLADAFRGREQSVLISFPLAATPLFKAVHEIVRSGRLGTINQIQANCNVSYGGCYYGQWYREYDEVGGLWLQKATHDFDYLTRLIDRRPLMIAATTSQMIYGGDMPHNLKCSQCDKAQTCIESHVNHVKAGVNPSMCKTADDPDHWCCFSEEIKNQDAGSALIMYEGGVHVVYTQNFVSRRGAGKRGAVITGHNASLEFDWVTEKIIVHDHFAVRDDVIDIKATSGHAGGDHVLAENFINIMRGKGNAMCDLTDGIRSVTMCLAARQSAYDRQFVPIVPPGVDAQSLPQPVLASEVPV